VQACWWQTISERGVVRLREHVKHLNFGGYSKPYFWNCWSSQALSTYFAGECCKHLMVVDQLLITRTVEICIQQLDRVKDMVWLPYDGDTEYLACAEPPRLAGLSAAAKTCFHTVMQHFTVTVGDGNNNFTDCLVKITYPITDLTRIWYGASLVF